jgi:cell division protein FtsL
VSGPVRPATRPARPARARDVAGDAGLLIGLLAALEGLAQHRLLDRLIRGRTWIGLLAFALIGIVTLQLGLLKLNGGIGRALEHEALLQRENAALSIENSELSAGSRVEARATQLGMAFVASGALRFLAVRPHGDAAQAASALSTSGRSSSAEAPQAAGGSSESHASVQSPAVTESSSAESTTPASSREASSSEAGSSSSEAGESSGSSAESTASARSAPPPTEAAPSAAAEAGPAGGIQASSTGE